MEKISLFDTPELTELDSDTPGLVAASDAASQGSVPAPEQTLLWEAPASRRPLDVTSSAYHFLPGNHFCMIPSMKSAPEYPAAANPNSRFLLTCMSGAYWEMAARIPAIAPSTKLSDSSFPSNQSLTVLPVGLSLIDLLLDSDDGPRALSSGAKQRAQSDEG
jgi:hypothetical protein